VVTSVDIDPAYRRDRTGHDAAVVHLGSPTAAPAIGIATAETAGLAAPGARLLLTGWGMAPPPATGTVAPGSRVGTSYGTIG
jgi:hypothetical protein